MRQTVTAIFLLVSFGLGNAWAASTQWEDLGGGKARLVAVLDPASGEVSGAIEFQLEEGWKTYWRQPGASGIPPEFDFSASSNFEAAAVLFPLPQHIKLDGTEFIGYRGRVLFPFSGKLNGDQGEGAIRLMMLAGVCDEVCIPATQQFELPAKDLLHSDFEAMSVLEAAQMALPQAPTDDFRIVSARIENLRELIAEVQVPAGGQADELFAEGPEGWFFGPGNLAPGDDGRSVFHLPVLGSPPDAETSGLALRFTAVSGTSGIEQTVRIER
ncbi:MAG: protein-disulfide reductase DsbD domain-containing protein [Rhizobiaceae bacterium]